ncbi:hypothetical protein Scep_006392 [Stephania cephalantha]|uniref:Uncharacterized protein n=1 Tax=Stephania cephalantha TaxID=152367 RepID=A0AAP0K943_9MAGN
MQTADDTRNSVKEEPIEGDQRLRRSRAEQRRRRRRAQPAAGEDCGGDRSGGRAEFELRRRVVLGVAALATEQWRRRSEQRRRGADPGVTGSGGAGGSGEGGRDGGSREGDAAATNTAAAVVARLLADVRRRLSARRQCATLTT